MAIQEAVAELRPEIIQQAAAHYVECLNLPPTSQVLIVTDRLDPGTPVDPHMTVRRQMSKLIGDHLAVGGFRVQTVAFDHSLSREEIYTQTKAALEGLEPTDPNQPADNTTTVVYLGDVWANRRGMYDAASDFGTDKRVRVAGSLGFKTGDCRVMSQLTSERRATIAETNEYFETFFGKHPRGKFTISTTDAGGITYNLVLDYDTAQSPFGSDMGQFDEQHQVFIGNFVYINIPGGEKFGSPFPFQRTNGLYVAEGIYFHVKDGLVDEVIVPDTVLEQDMEPSQKQLLAVVRSGGTLPVSELGLGFYALAGITTYADSSVLSREKGGPHIGNGHAPGESAEEAEMERLSGDFHHTDFVMDKPEIVFQDPETGETIPFYPPQAQ